ncbi:MAG: hypothetical protein P8P22_06350 [Porticoccaceae bacterium]|jgi:hypothetical protein|nr:hypothetical protein [Porticoccaceae bacterium]MDG1307748.1 hypothetical protein [Porticoccaceae bacterium]
MRVNNQPARSFDSKGQAMIEFSVTVSFVFLAIFVFVPTFGKLMDLQLQNLMASRYIAWERTVWFDQINDDNRDDFVISNNEFESVAVRTDSDIMNSAETRFFLNHGGLLPMALIEDDLNSPRGAASPIWTYVQSKKTMYGGSTLRSFDAKKTPSIAYEIGDALASGIKTVKDPIDFLLSAIGNNNEDMFEFPLVTSKNYYNPILATRLNVGNAHGAGESVWERVDGSTEFTPGIESAFFKREGERQWNTFESRSAILADGWNAQSIKHYKDRADDYVPSTLFQNKMFETIIDLASFLENGRSNSAIGKLGFGEVGVEPMPAEDGQPATAVCGDGFCSFEGED